MKTLFKTIEKMAKYGFQNKRNGVGLTKRAKNHPFYIFN